MASCDTKTISNDTLQGSEYRHSTSTSTQIKKSIDFAQHVKSSITQITNDFISEYMEFKESLPEMPSHELLEEMYNKSLRSPDSKLLQNNPFHERIQLALCGTNSSGKTTFLHSFLEIKNILPINVGPVTARIVKFTYAPASHACLRIYPSIQQAYLERYQPEVNLSLEKYFCTPTTDWKGLKDILHVHVARPEIDGDEFIAWAKKYVEIRIPSPTLELGIEVYDTPGLLFHDYEILKTNLRELVACVRPTLVFLYSNTTIDKEANEGYLTILSTLKDLKQPPVFYLNTKQDITTLFNGAGISANRRDAFTPDRYKEIFPKERLKRYHWLYEAIGKANDLPKIDEGTSIQMFNEICDNFDISSICERQPLPDCAVEMTKQACQRIVEFSMNTEMTNAWKMADSILAIIEDFFNFTKFASYTTKEQVQHTYNHAKTWGVHFFQQFENDLSELNEEIYQNMLRHFDERMPNLIQRASKLDRSDDPLKKKTKSIVNKNIKEFIKIAIEEEVLKPAANEVVINAKDRFQLKMNREISIDKDNNELLVNAQRQTLRDMSLDDLAQRGWIRELLCQLWMVPTSIRRMMNGFRTLPYREYYNRISLEAVKSNEEYLNIIDAMDSFSILDEESKRREFAAGYLRKRRSIVENEKSIYHKNIRAWIEQQKRKFDQNIYLNHKLILSHLDDRKKIYASAGKFVQRFAEVQCRLVAIQDLWKFRGEEPTIDKTQELGQGSHFIVYSAEWSTVKNLAVKMLKPSSKEYSYLQYLEAHNHRKITQLQQMNVSQGNNEMSQDQQLRIVPLLYLYHQYSQNGNELYIFMPKYKENLQTYLQRNIKKISPDFVLHIALSVIDALILLHTNGLVHRDIKAKNILMDENQQCYLSDFGTTKETFLNSTVLGTFPFAPEVQSQSSYDGMSADVYSFGIFLYEILPKHEFHRPCTVITAKELLSNMQPLNPHNRMYEELIESCLNPSAKDRPTATEIKAQLKICERELQRKACIVCEDKLRTCRFQPCGHKLICEPCFGKLEKTDSGTKKCIVCNRTIERLVQDNNNDTYIGENK